MREQYVDEEYQNIEYVITEYIWHSLIQEKGYSITSRVTGNEKDERMIKGNKFNKGEDEGVTHLNDVVWMKEERTFKGELN